MKMLIISDAWHPQINGVVRTYEYMIPELEKAGHEVKVIGPSDFPVHLPMPGYREIELALFAARQLRKMMTDFNSDSIHIATEGPLGLAARRHCIKNKIPFTTAYHTQFPDYVAKRVQAIARKGGTATKRAMIKWIKGFHNPSAAVMVATPTLEEELRSWNFRAPLRRLTRGVVTDIFHHEGPRALQDLPKPVALYVGRVAIEKNIGAFLEMEWSGSKVVVGGGPGLEDMKRKYPGAHFTGPKTGHDLAAHYRGADVFVFPSKTDTFGLVITEALACGLPVAGYDVMGPRDIVTAPALGALTANDLAGAARRALAAAGSAEDRFHHVLEHYTWPIVAQQFADISEETRITKPAS